MSVAGPEGADRSGQVVVARANLRDVGGRRTGDGRVIAPRRLYRGGRLSELSPAEVDAVRRLGLRTVVDLRRPAEIDAHPSPALTGAETVPISTSRDDNEFAVLAAGLAEPGSVDDPTEMARAYFREIVESGLDRYRPVFELIVSTDRHPLLFHCTAGKDRTGFVAAMLLGMLGVPREEILDDYELTNEVRRGTVASRRRALLGDDPDPRRAHLVDTMMLAQRPFMAAALDAVDACFDGDWRQFRRRGLGIGDEQFATFVDALCIAPDDE